MYIFKRQFYLKLKYYVVDCIIIMHYKFKQKHLNMQDKPEKT